MQNVLDRIHLSYTIFENHHFHLPESQTGKRWLGKLPTHHPRQAMACLYFPSTVCETRGISCNNVSPEATGMSGPPDPWAPPGQSGWMASWEPTARTLNREVHQDRAALSINAIQMQDDL